MKKSGFETTKEHGRIRDGWKRVVPVLGLAVAFVTVVSLMLPAITMTHKERVLHCAYQVHQHSEDCYAEVDGVRTLVCGYADYVVHVHNDDCYNEQGELICPLPEIPAHQHDESCYNEAGELTCGRLELHTHTEDCYDKDGNLICGQLQLEEHRHTEECLSEVDVTDPVEETVSDTASVEQSEAVVVKQPEETETPAADASAEETAMPAQEFQERINQVTVAVSAEEGAFPVGTTMQLQDVADEQTIQTITNTVDGEVKRVHAVDISFQTADGQVVDPLKPIHVSMSSDLDVEDNETVVVQVDDTGKAKVVEQSLTADEVTFDTDSLSVYAIVETVIETDVITADGKSYTISVTYGEDAEIPNGAVLEATEIVEGTKKYDKYVTRTAEALGDEENPAEISFARFFDIGIMNDGKKIEPKAPVAVKISYADAAEIDEATDLSVVHFGAKGTEVLEASDNRKDGSFDEVEFQTESFSVYSTVAAKTPLKAASMNTSNGIITLSQNQETVTVTLKFMNGSTQVDANLSGKPIYAYLWPANDQNANVYGAPIQLTQGEDYTVGKATITHNNLKAGQYYLTLYTPKNDNSFGQMEWQQNGLGDTQNQTVVVARSDSTAGSHYINGFNVPSPLLSGATISGNDVTINVTLPDSLLPNFDSSSFWGDAINYGVTAKTVNLNSQQRSNFATDHLTFNNATPLKYDNRVLGDDPVPNLIGELSGNGQFQIQDHNSDYYVPAETSQIIHNDTSSKGSQIVKEASEIKSKVNDMIENTLTYAKQFTGKEMVTIPLTKNVWIDTTSYDENAIIVLDANAIANGDNIENVEITKKPGQTIVFNMTGSYVTIPKNTIVHVEGQSDVKAGNQGQNAPASDGDIWSHIIWNCPNATTVQLKEDIGGVILAHQENSTVKVDNGGNGSGWIISNGTVEIQNQWYAFPGTIDPFEPKVTDKEIELVKVGYDNVTDHSAPLSGAEFAIYKEANNQKGDLIQDKLVSDNNGVFYTGTLANGTYLLEETKTPAGYYAPGGMIKLTVSDSGMTFSTMGGVSEPSKVATITNSNDKYTLTVRNTTGYELPSTGGPGTTLFLKSGLLLMTVSLSGLALQRRRRTAAQ